MIPFIGKEIDSKFVHLMFYVIPVLASYHIINEHVYMFIGRIVDRKKTVALYDFLKNLLLLLPWVVKRWLEKLHKSINSIPVGFTGTLKHQSNVVTIPLGLV